MKALFNLKSALNKSALINLAALVTLVPAIYPEVAAAQTTQAPKVNSAIVFEINDPSKLEDSDQNQNLLTVEELKNTDPLTLKLRVYLEEHNSPLAAYADELHKQPQWQRALAISWVESNFGRFCANNNCSGIGVAPGHPAWRKYDTKLDWFKDMSALMETPRYKEKYTTFEKMRGIYVYPGTDNWVYGSKKKYAELMALTSEAENERLLVVKNAQEAAELHTFPQLAMAK
jgi:hypothetical protein